MSDGPPIGMLVDRPPDPIGVAHSGVERTRRELRRIDPRLDLWWCRKKDRWKVMEMVADGVWSYVFYWWGTNKEYRPPDWSDEMGRRLSQCDWDRQEIRDADCHDLRAEISPRRAEMLKAKAEEVAYFKKHVVDDWFQRGAGVRQTFGPGGKLRSRHFINGQSTDLKEASREFFKGNRIPT